MINRFAIDNTQSLYDVLIELLKIPAPSHSEHKRAEYCKKIFESYGAKNVYIDDALNTIFPLNCEGSNEITVLCAHTDTVFPDTEPMPYIDDGEKIHSPGVSDDTASVVVLLHTAKFFLENNISPEKGILFVCNSCEEGLGNLKGTRQLFKDYEGRISRLITFDSQLHSVCDRSVGSHRYEVEVLTEGGHSYGAFGNTNAISVISKIIDGIYQTEVPKKDGCRTTYNVGTISGGTSVNTIAQNAKMLCEYRSDDKECLEIMQKRFEELFALNRSEKIEVNVTKVGDRPCGDVSADKMEELRSLVIPVIENEINEKVSLHSGSTDCNIPHSLGIPALAIGVNTHYGVHTREEWVDKKSMVTGLLVAIKVAIKLSEVEL